MDKAEKLALIDRRFGEGVPHNRALGLRAVDLLPDGFVSELPYAAHLVGNPATGAVHGGVITSLIDASSGMAVFIAMPAPSRIATLDLRIDYLKPSSPDSAVRCRARCYKVTRRIAFTRAVAYCEDPDDPIATSAGTFMIFDNPAGSINPREPEGAT